MSKTDKNGRAICIAFAQFSSTWFATRCIKMVQVTLTLTPPLRYPLNFTLTCVKKRLTWQEWNAIDFPQMGMIGHVEFVLLTLLVGGRLNPNPAGLRPEVGVPAEA